MLLWAVHLLTSHVCQAPAYLFRNHTHANKVGPRKQPAGHTTFSSSLLPLRAFRSSFGDIAIVALPALCWLMLPSCLLNLLYQSPRILLLFTFGVSPLPPSSHLISLNFQFSPPPNTATHFPLLMRVTRGGHRLCMYSEAVQQDCGRSPSLLVRNWTDESFSDTLAAYIPTAYATVSGNYALPLFPAFLVRSLAR